MASDFCGGWGSTSFMTSPRPTTSPAVFARGTGDGSVRNTAGAGTGEALSVERFTLAGCSLEAISAGAFVAGFAAGCSWGDSAGFVAAGGSLIADAEVEEGPL